MTTHTPTGKQTPEGTGGQGGGSSPITVWVAYSPVDPHHPPALLSAIARLAEELSPHRITVASFMRQTPGKTGLSPEEIRGNIQGELEKCCPRLKEKVEHKEITLRGHVAVDWAQRIAGELTPLARGSRVVFNATPSSRLLATEGGLALGRLLVGNSRRYALVYLDFLWGQWRGLYYPYTPRAVHPLHVARPGFLEDPSDTEPPRTASSLFTQHPPSKALDKELGVLRQGVVRLALALNRITPAGFWAPSGEEFPKGPTVFFELSLDGQDLHGITVNHVYDPSSWEKSLNAARALIDEVSSMALDREGGAHQLHGFTGLSVAVSRGLEGKDSVLVRIIDVRGEVVVDTNLVYRGVHNEVLRGARIVLPECAVAEIQRRFSEALKKTGGVRGRRALDLLAFAALQEALQAGAVVAPSPPPPCDTSIPGMNSLILTRTRLATLDEGARRYWEWHPGIPKKNVLQLEEAELEKVPRDQGEPIYALLQSIVVAGVFAVLSGVYKRASVRIESEEFSESVNLTRFAEALQNPASQQSP